MATSSGQRQGLASFFPRPLGTRETVRVLPLMAFIGVNKRRRTECFYRALGSNELGLDDCLRELPAAFVAEFRRVSSEGRAALEQGDWKTAELRFLHCAGMLKVAKSVDRLMEDEPLVAWVNHFLAQSYQAMGSHVNNLREVMDLRKKILTYISSLTKWKGSNSYEHLLLLERVCKIYCITAQYELGEALGDSSNDKEEAIQQCFDNWEIPDDAAEAQICFFLCCDHDCLGKSEESLRWIRKANRVRMQASSTSDRWKFIFLDYEARLLMRLQMFSEAADVFKELCTPGPTRADELTGPTRGVHKFLHECYSVISRRAAEQAKPFEEQAKPFEEQAKPFVEKAKSSREQAKALEKEAKAMEKQRKPLEQQAKPLEEGAKPLEEVAMPLEEVAMPLEEEARPLEGARPLEEGVKALEEQAKALEEQAKALEEQAKALEEQAKAFEELAKPFKEQAKPFKEQAEPFNKEAKAYEELATEQRKLMQDLPPISLHNHPAWEPFWGPMTFRLGNSGLGLARAPSWRGIDLYFSKLPELYEMVFKDFIEKQADALTHCDWELATIYSEQMRVMLKMIKMLLPEATYDWLLSWVDLPLAGLYHYHARSHDKALRIWKEIQECEASRNSGPADADTLELSTSKGYQISFAALEYEMSFSNPSPQKMIQIIEKWTRAYCTDEESAKRELRFWLYFGYHRHGNYEHALKWLDKEKELRLNEESRCVCSRKRGPNIDYFCCACDYKRCEIDLLNEDAVAARKWLLSTKQCVQKDGFVNDDIDDDQLVDKSVQGQLPSANPTATGCILRVEHTAGFHAVPVGRLVQSPVGLEHHLLKLPLPIQLAFRKHGYLGHLYELELFDWENAVFHYECCLEILETIQIERNPDFKKAYDWLMVWVMVPLADLYEVMKKQYRLAFDLRLIMLSLIEASVGSADQESLQGVRNFLTEAACCAIYMYAISYHPSDPVFKGRVIRVLSRVLNQANHLTVELDIMRATSLKFMHVYENIEGALDLVRREKELLDQMYPEPQQKLSEEYERCVRAEMTCLWYLQWRDELKRAVDNYSVSTDNEFPEDMRFILVVTGEDSRAKKKPEFWVSDCAEKLLENSKDWFELMSEGAFGQTSNCELQELRKRSREHRKKKEYADAIDCLKKCVEEIRKNPSLGGLGKSIVESLGFQDKLNIAILHTYSFARDAKSEQKPIEMFWKDEDFLGGVEYYKQCLRLVSEGVALPLFRSHMVQIYERLCVFYYYALLNSGMDGFLSQRISGDLQARREHDLNKVKKFLEVLRNLPVRRIGERVIALYTRSLHTLDSKQYTEGWIEWLEGHKILYTILQHYYTSKARLLIDYIGMKSPAAGTSDPFYTQGEVDASWWNAFLFAEGERTRVMMYQYEMHRRKSLKPLEVRKWRLDVHDRGVLRSIKESCRALLEKESTVFVQYSSTLHVSFIYVIRIDQDGCKLFVENSKSLDEDEGIKKFTTPKRPVTPTTRLDDLYAYLAYKQDKYRKLRRYSSITDDESMNKYLEFLYGALIAPIENHLEKVKLGVKLVLAPSELLTRVPFAALRKPGNDQRRLIERFAFSIVPSLRVLQMCSDRLQDLQNDSRRPYTGRRGSIIALGNPTYSAGCVIPSCLHPDSLKATGKEVKKLVELFGDTAVKTLRKTNATAKNLLEWAAKPSQESFRQAIVHIGAHGHIDNVDQRNTKLQLACDPPVSGQAKEKLDEHLEDDCPDGDESDSEGEDLVNDDGALKLGSSSSSSAKSRRFPSDSSASSHDLTVEVINNLETLWTAELLVLSACETSGGRLTAEGVLSLARAFMAAGVPCVVASLWKVDDVETLALMKDFYDELRKGNDVASALQTATLQCMHKHGPDAVQYWAPFNVWGVPSLRIPRELQRKESLLPAGDDESSDNREERVESYDGNAEDDARFQAFVTSSEVESMASTATAGTATAAPVQLPQGQADLADFVEWQSLECLNENPNHTFVNALKQESSKTEGEGSETGVERPKIEGEGPKIEGEGPKIEGEGPWTSTMSKTLELVVSTIKLLEGARPSTIDNSPGNSSLFMLILSQLRRSGSLLKDLPVESILDWHDFIFEELQWAVNRTSTLVGHSRGISIIPTEARGEYFLETLLDLRWWTWQIEFQAGMDQGFRPFHYYFGAFEGVLEAKSPSGDSMTRSLPSYSLERFQKAEIKERRFVEGPQLKNPGKSEEENAIYTRIRKAELPLFIIKALRPTTIQDAKKPSSFQDYLEIDLTQDLLGASSTGYVIRTTCSDGEEGFCALKKINTMDDKPPDLAKLWHPHVVQLKHHWSEETALHDVARGWIPKSTFMTFLVMELMDCDLATLISRTKKTGIAPFSLRFGVDVMLQIAKGMLYLHEMGVSHPHLKCENVLCKLQNKTETFREGEGRVNLGEVLVKLGGFGCSRPATLHNKKWDVFCFGLTCLEILTGKEYWSEDIYGADASSIPTIPETTPLILKYCIASCLDKELALNFSEVVMLLLLAQLQIMRTYEGGTMLSIESLHIENEQTRNQDSASFSRSYGNLQEMFHVRELHPQLGAVPTPVQITLIFFHGFPKVSEEWRLTWMTRDNKLLWPQKWLPEDLDGNIRVLSLSFDDTLDVSSNRIQPDSEISKALLQTLVLSATWKLGEIEHAIVLVGHGFGGVIIKLLVTEAQSFVRNAQQNSKDFQDVEVMRCKRFLERLASVVFYSVPHDHAPTNTEFNNYILGCSKTRVLQRSSMVKSLRGDDRFIGEMIQLSEDFENALPHKTKVLAFLEGEPMSKVQNLFLVTEKSYEGLSCTLHKVEKDNHFEVCRPDSKSHTGYKALLLHIQQHMFSIPTDEIVKEPGGAAGYSAREGAPRGRSPRCRYVVWNHVTVH